MKNRVVSVFIIISCLLIGCEDSVVNKITDESKDSVVVKELKKEQLKVEEDTKHRVVLPKQEKMQVKRKVLKAKANLVTKAEKSEIEHRTTMTDEVQSRRILDLTLPVEMKEKIALNNSYQKQAYLPDLFPGRNKIRYPLHVNGKMINRVENEADKVSSIDGVGIDVRLYP